MAAAPRFVGALLGGPAGFSKSGSAELGEVTGDGAGLGRLALVLTVCAATGAGKIDMHTKTKRTARPNPVRPECRLKLERSADPGLRIIEAKIGNVTGVLPMHKESSCEPEVRDSNIDGRLKKIIVVLPRSD